ncbi:alpha-L-rhamnosidase [Pseudoxanthomonas sp. GM95]|uniref:family 78 glycoside hydrolase catalytic domain n=1 Tax=Pseudoxanthomonas sp. GM95 TaxID=1881043 RepID=UPI0008CA0DD4|nr:family 78 glycoside hydrolase catalytic domain [Pseudoxanthomonas sp. GM95]SEL51705.1 alpha-L-rhamnosidase [Pseudoxanthomonas sp. GM95]
MHLASLSVESTDRPLALATEHPRFAWVVQDAPRGTAPVAYRIEVARSRQALDQDQPDVWDSGDVTSHASFGVAYEGPALQPFTRYYWKVVATTTQGRVSAQSWFERGPMTGEDWSASAWISKPANGTTAAPLLRTGFTVAPGLRTARLYVAAGGYADVSINGQPASDAVLSPDFTDYDKRVLYQAHDVTDRLVPGRNAIGIVLGRGFYGLTNPNVWHWEKAPWHGEPRVRALLRLCYDDGRCQTVGTGPDWKAHVGPTLLDDVYGGETYDARAAQPGFDRPEFDDRRWAHAALLPAPKGVLQAQVEPPIRVAQTLAATAVSQPRPGVYVFAFPRVIAGWATLKVHGKPGDTVTMTYGEKLLPNGSVDARDDHHYFKQGFQTDRVTLAGTGEETWHPRFSWKGFRYVQLDGWPGDTPPSLEAVTAQVVHTDAKVIGHFSSSNTLLDWIHTATVDTLLNNLYGLPTDTPMYEKNGWTGDGMLGADMMLRNLAAAPLLAKWVQDIADTRTPQGAPLLIAPNPGWGTGRAPPWHAAYVLVPWSLYWQRGDHQVLADHAPGMARYVDLEDQRSPDGIAETDLGDWVSPSTAPDGENAPEDKRIAATAYLYRMAIAMADVGTALDDAAMARHFATRAAAVRTAFNARFFDAATGRYRGEGDDGVRQTHQLLALDFGLVSDEQRTRVADALVDAVHAHDDHLDTGALGTKLLLPTLTDTGHPDLAMKVATQTTFPGWGFWHANGATSLWEHWKLASRSRGHYFLGTIDDWLYDDVAGLRPLAPGWQRIGIQPALTRQLDHAAADTLTPYGKASVDWTRTPTQFRIAIDIPVGAEADVRLPVSPDAPLEESGQPLRRVEGVRDVHACGEDVCFVLASGRYRFAGTHR